MDMNDLLELDISMAEIMGWRRVESSDIETEPDTRELRYVYCVADFDCFGLGKTGDAVYYRHVCNDKFRPFWPSLCIQSAWWLVERFGMQCGYAIHTREPFAMCNGESLTAETVLLAICKMALKMGQERLDADR